MDGVSAVGHGRERRGGVRAALVARGLTNAEIGGELFSSAGTAKTHVAHIQAKLGVRNRVDIAAWAWHHGVAST